MSREVNRIVEYLHTRPIAPILGKSDEKENLTALKVMSILDFEMDRNQMYDRIRSATNSDTLMMQLMHFHTFQSFKFYEYNVKREIKQFALQCTSCGLLGPYAYILSHMAMNHNAHMGLKMCLYCDRCELQKHIDNNSLDRCYKYYLRERNINELDPIVCKIVTEFYDLLKKISEKFSPTTIRNHNYAAKRTSRRVNSVSISSSTLDDEFNQIALNIRNDNLSRRPRNGSSAASKINGTDDSKYLPDVPGENGNMADEEEDDDVMIVDVVKIEPVLDIHPSQNEPTTSGMHYRSESHGSVMAESVSIADLLPPNHQFERSDAEEFGRFVAQSLSKLPTEIQRRKLEIQIETAILNAKRAAFQ